MAYATRGAVKSLKAAALATAVPYHLTLGGADSLALAPLVAEEKSANDINKEIPHNVVLFLQGRLKAGKRYEAQLYGVFTSILTQIFRPSRYYEVSPQGVLREVVEAQTVGLDSISIGSTGAVHKSGGIEEKKLPDFICYKCIQVQDRQGGSELKRFIVTAVELKRDKSSWNDAKIQMRKYLLEIMKHKYRDDEVLGFLIQGQRKAAYFKSIKSNKHLFGSLVSIEEFKIFGDDDLFIRELCIMSSHHWNLDIVEAEESNVEETEEGGGEETKQSDAEDTEERDGEETEESDAEEANKRDEEETEESDAEGTQESDGEETEESDR